MSQLPSLRDLDDDALREWYAPPRTPWCRLNFVATVDGAIQGADGLSGSINNDADHRAFGALRDLADVVIVGAGTVRDEAYRPNPKPMVVVTRSGRIPPSLLEGPTDQLLIATCARAPGLEETKAMLGDGQVLVLGEEAPDLTRMVGDLVDRGHRELLCEGGAHLAGDLLAAGLVDELCLTTVPQLVGGDRLRAIAGRDIDVPLRLAGMLEDDGTLLARWQVG